MFEQQNILKSCIHLYHFYFVKVVIPEEVKIISCEEHVMRLTKAFNTRHVILYFNYFDDLMILSFETKAVEA